MTVTTTTTLSMAPATNPGLAVYIMGLEDKLYEAAELELSLIDGNFTAIERQAMLEGEALRKTNGLELGAIILRGRIIARIVDKGLARQHPNQYPSLREMASDCGLSHTELSKTQALVDIVFPGLESLGFSIAALWEDIGKSKFMDLVPYFRVLMTGEESASQHVNDTLGTLLDSIHATAQSGGQRIRDEDATIEAIEQLVERGVNLPSRELRTSLRRETTPIIETTYIRSNGRTLIIAEVDEDQMTMFERIMGTHTTPQLFELPADPTARMLEASQIPAIVKVADLISITR